MIKTKEFWVNCWSEGANRGEALTTSEKAGMTLLNNWVEKENPNIINIQKRNVVNSWTHNCGVEITVYYKVI